MGIKLKYRLKSRSALQLLMSEGERLKSYPVHVVFRKEERVPDEPQIVQIAVSAPKRIHRKAVDRNKAKRKLREIIRPLIPQLENLMDQSGITCDMMFIYVGREIVAADIVSEKINGLLTRLESQLILPSDESESKEVPKES